MLLFLGPPIIVFFVVIDLLGEGSVGWLGRLAIAAGFGAIWGWLVRVLLNARARKRASRVDR